jgi:hypothetical protein
MMIRLNWIEFVTAGCERLKELNPQFEVGDPSFRTDHGSYNGGIGDSYDLPHFVDFEIKRKEPSVPNESDKAQESLPETPL